MAFSTAQRDIVGNRRMLVAKYRLRGMSERLIAETIAIEGSVNPKSGNPWDCATIHNDIVALLKEWKEAAITDMAALKAEQCERLDAVQVAAWTAQEYQHVLNALKQRAEVLGVNAPVVSVGEFNFTNRPIAELESELASLQGSTGAGDTTPQDTESESE